MHHFAVFTEKAADKCRERYEILSRQIRQLVRYFKSIKCSVKVFSAKISAVSCLIAETVF